MELKRKIDEHLFKTGEKVTISFPQISKDEEFKFFGSHLPGKSNTDAIYVEVHGCCNAVPQGLTKHFPNMKILGIIYVKLQKICKEDLAEYKNLEGFICQNTDLMFLPRNLFDGFKNLKFIDFYRNKLKIVEPNILDGLDKLEFVDFRRNRNYFKDFSNNPYFYSCMTLSGIKSHLFERFFTLDEQIIMKYMENYPEKLNLLKILKDQVEEVDLRFRKHELIFEFPDPNMMKERKEFEQQMNMKIEELENLNSKLINKVKNLEESKSKIKEQIEELKIELDNENDEMVKFIKNLQTQIDRITSQI